MTRTAVIMAGGRSERMARSGIRRPKVLVQVAGATLLERNLQMVLRSGVGHVHVSVAAGDAEVRSFVAGPLQAVARRAAAGPADAVDELVEDEPLGNIGAIGLLAGSVDSVLVVYADNLTGIDLRQIYDDHLDGDADLTLAAHRMALPMPFGELTADVADPTRLATYTEKPTYEPLVASAVMVLGRRAVERAAATRPLGISQLAQSLVDEGGVVRLWPHASPWIDVNDASAIAEAEQLVARHPDVFGPLDPAESSGEPAAVSS